MLLKLIVVYLNFKKKQQYFGKTSKVWFSFPGVFFIPLAFLWPVRNVLNTLRTTERFV